jgi:hypothetical protein
MRPRTTTTAVALALTLAACSSNSGSTGSNASLPALCTKLGHSFTEETGEHELYTSDQGECGQLTLRAFNGSGTRDQWLKVAQNFGGNYLVGDGWVVTADDPAVLDAARTKVGGERR